LPAKAETLALAVLSAKTLTARKRKVSGPFFYAIFGGQKASSLPESSARRSLRKWSLGFGHVSFRAGTVASRV
jgi:hypothetical protein